jgi:hypothetical protein
VDLILARPNHFPQIDPPRRAAGLLIAAAKIGGRRVPLRAESPRQLIIFGRLVVEVVNVPPGRVKED